jgi:hypothetical protein
LRKSQDPILGSKITEFRVSAEESHVCKQHGIENDGLVIFRKLGFSFSRTERDFVAVPQARKKLLFGGRYLGCPS